MTYEWKQGEPRGEWGWPIGTLLLIPRDVPLVLDWENQRYLVIEATEVMMSFTASLEDLKKGFEIIPWGWGVVQS